MGLVAKNIANVHPEVRAVVIKEASTRGITISDVIGETIALAWEMAYELSGKRAVGIERLDSPQLLLGVRDDYQFVVRIPQEMAVRIYLVSRSRGLTESSVVQELLADRFGIPYVPVKRGGRRREKEATS